MIEKVKRVQWRNVEFGSCVAEAEGASDLEAAYD